MRHGACEVLLQSAWPQAFLWITCLYRTRPLVKCQTRNVRCCCDEHARAVCMVVFMSEDRVFMALYGIRIVDRQDEREPYMCMALYRVCMALYRDCGTDICGTDICGSDVVYPIHIVDRIYNDISYIGYIVISIYNNISDCGSDIQRFHLVMEGEGSSIAPLVNKIIGMSRG